MLRDSTVVRLRLADAIDDPLSELAREGARRMLAQALIAEADAFIALWKDVKLPDGRDRVVRHGHGPERAIQTGVGPVAVRRAKVRELLANFGQGMSTLTITNLQFTNAGTYVVSVTNTALPFGAVSNSLPAILTVFLDSDGDRMADVWETAHGLDPNNPNDAGIDSDGDGLTNLQEYLAGTDPQDGNSYLRIEAAPLASGGGAVLRFFAVSNKTYSVLYANSPDGGPWQRLADISAVQTNRTVAITNAPPGVAGRYYRLATPIAP
jgi:hypothetical protein